MAASENAMIPLHAAARAAGLSESTLRRLVRDGLVEAVKDGHRLQITQATVLELRAGGALKRGAAVNVRESDRIKTELAAACFERFREGRTLISIVEELHALPATVKLLWHEWLDLQSEQRRAIKLACLHEGHGDACDGPPQPQISLCSHHAAKSRILTPEQQAVLRGKEIPKASNCKACGEFAAECVCSACLELYTVMTVEGSPEDRRIVVRVRDQVILSEPATGIANQLGTVKRSVGRPKKEPPSSSAPVPTGPSKEDIDDVIRAAQEALKR